jgi:ubiquinone/menaquinone biosynthesis C-methylase UbiE
VTENDIISAAKERFDKELHSKEYRKIHSDDEQLIKIVDLMDIEDAKYYLDLGTGNGYVAFYLAKKYPLIKVYGLDIAENSIIKNNEIRKNEQIYNIDFISYSGNMFPFETGKFNGLISRYAFHHFPDVEKSVSEISRVLENGGYFLLSDPLTYEEDTDNFIDEFQTLKNDGHVHFYKRDEIESIFKKNNFEIEKEIYSVVRYPRNMTSTYKELFDRTYKEILEKYKIEIEDDKVYITANVMNIVFRKKN